MWSSSRTRARPRGDPYPLPGASAPGRRMLPAAHLEGLAPIGPESAFEMPIHAACLPCNFSSGAAISCHLLPTQRVECLASSGASRRGARHHLDARLVGWFRLILAEEDHLTYHLLRAGAPGPAIPLAGCLIACLRAVSIIAIHGTGREHRTSPATTATQSMPCSGPGTESITPPWRRLHRV